ncbi:hypothetical protein Kpol_1002p69 [Vanderwaltozyma polyspora DSM 70294]|uniref:RRM domain-containing protein n=1 Tax=Vanderwaltozyma polyspora (strain ATCC 22028 / DSM 70294 / BCRC 21397 / CBS 2163 / NBRC 10782 / NRRL Y-8283 / UCD 57-17) TaxID=436907 RepID=A7TEA0_VANPO|nr:uncharacterized protein Kpol_1002p69 [Vanderwaltozyma polyspora DSM 70294]EDO19422.1 hypothetical protein Kpol_1002p69 [Vanderwaltozyma polyspora DSM 70294]
MYPYEKNNTHILNADLVNQQYLYSSNERTPTPGFETQQMYNDLNNMSYSNNGLQPMNGTMLQQMNSQTSSDEASPENWSGYPFQENNLNHQQMYSTMQQTPTGHLYGSFSGNGHYYTDERSISSEQDQIAESPYLVAAAAAAAISKTENNLPLQNSFESPVNFTSAPSRTVYLGNIPTTLTVKELLDHVRSGVVEDVKILPEKMCAFISFVDDSSALLFHSDAILKRLNIEGRDIKIGWGKPTKIDPIVANGITTDGATRNVYIGQLYTDAEVAESLNIPKESEIVTEERLIADLEIYGDIDSVKIVKEKGIAFIHFASILSAIKVVNNLAASNRYYQNRKIFYGKDRCAFITKTQQHNAAQFLGVQPGLAYSGQFSDREFISNALLQQSAAAAAIATSAGGPNNLGNRTVYLGNLPKGIKIEEICNTVRSGLLQSVKLLSDRHVCFVTFIDPTAAAQFYAMSSLHGLILQRKRCKVGWGKHSGPLPNLIALAVSNGASRNVYIGNIDFEEDSKRNERVFTEDNLRKLFQEYGEVEQINFLPSKNCCFINYTNISNAISAIDKIKSNPYFKDLKINFGKDRCGNIPHQLH